MTVKKVNCHSVMNASRNVLKALQRKEMSACPDAPRASSTTKECAMPPVLPTKRLDTPVSPATRPSFKTIPTQEQAMEVELATEQATDHDIHPLHLITIIIQIF